MVSPESISGSDYLLPSMPSCFSSTKTVVLEEMADLTQSGYHTTTYNDFHIASYLIGVLVWYETKSMALFCILSAEQ